jgi:ligand-binding sensor domain-containing protein
MSNCILKNTFKRTSIKRQILATAVLIILVAFFQGCKEDVTVTPTYKEVEGFEIYLPENEISSMLIDGDWLYVGGVNGLNRINRKTRETEKVEYGKPYQMVRALMRDDNGDFLIGHHNGIDIITDDGIKYITVKDGLPDDRINDIKKGTEKNELWVSTYTGVAHFAKGKWEVIDIESGLSCDIIMPILIDSRENVWLGGYAANNSGINLLTKDGFQYYNMENGLANNSVTAFIEDKENRIWVGLGVFKEGATQRFEYIEGKWTITKTLMMDDGLAGEKVRSLYIDDKERLWFCSEYDGVAVFDPVTLTRLFMLDTGSGLSDNEIKGILQDENGDYWLGARRGVTFIEKEVIEKLAKR